MQRFDPLALAALADQNDMSTAAAQGATRRDFLKSGATAGLILTTAGGLAACGSSGSSTIRGAKPKRGGTLTAALSSGGPSDTLDANVQTTQMDVARNAALYNSFIALDPNAQPQLVLAEEVSPNHDATVWTIRLRKGILFHDGKEATAEDVLFTFHRIANPKVASAGAYYIMPFDLGRMRAVDRYTVEIPCHQPYATFAAEMYCNPFNFSLVPVGYDPKTPIGTGPFKFQSFTPGTGSIFVRNENYFVSGRPYLDKLVINDFADTTSQLNALASSQADVVNLLSASAAAEARASGAVTVISNSGGYNPFTMRVDVPPFNDARVRQAFRLIVDRAAMRATVFGGHGLIANDVSSPFDPQYDTSLPQRHQDIEQAKFLLKQAGREGMNITLTTAPLAQGVIEAAQVFAQQATSAGVNVSIAQKTVSDFYGPNYKQWQFAQDNTFYYTYLPQLTEALLPNAPFNETHWPDKEDAARYVGLYNEATRTLDPAKQRELAHELQRIDWERGSYIITQFLPVINAHVKRVHGVVPSLTGIDLGNYSWDQMWVD